MEGRAPKYKTEYPQSGMLIIEQNKEIVFYEGCHIWAEESGWLVDQERVKNLMHLWSLFHDHNVQSSHAWLGVLT